MLRSQTLPDIIGCKDISDILLHTQAFGDGNSQYLRSMMLGEGGMDAPDKNSDSVYVDAYLYYIPKQLLVELKKYKEKSTVPVSEETASIVYTVLYQMWQRKKKDRKYLIVPYRIMYQYFEMLFTRRTTHRIFQFLRNSKAITYRKMKTYKMCGKDNEFIGDYSNDFLLIIQLNENHGFYKTFRMGAQVCVLSASYLKLMKILCEQAGKKRMNFVRLAFILQQMMYMSSDRAKQYKRKMTYKFWHKVMPWVSVRGFSTYMKFLEDVGLLQRKMKKHLIRKEEVTKKNEFPYWVFTETTYKIRPYEVIKKLYNSSIVEAFARRIPLLYGWNVFGRLNNRRWYHSSAKIMNEFSLLTTLDLNKKFWCKQECDDIVKIRRNYINLPYLVSHSESDEKALKPMAQALLVLPSTYKIEQAFDYYMSSGEKEELMENIKEAIPSKFTKLWKDLKTFLVAFNKVENEKRWINVDDNIKQYYEVCVWKKKNRISDYTDEEAEKYRILNQELKRFEGISDISQIEEEYRKAFEEYDNRLRYQYQPDDTYDDDYYCEYDDDYEYEDDYEYADADGYY